MAGHFRCVAGQFHRFGNIFLQLAIHPALFAFPFFHSFCQGTVLLFRFADRILNLLDDFRHAVFRSIFHLFLQYLFRPGFHRQRLIFFRKADQGIRDCLLDPVCILGRQYVLQRTLSLPFRQRAKIQRTLLVFACICIFRGFSLSKGNPAEQAERKNQRKKFLHRYPPFRVNELKTAYKTLRAIP